MPPADLNVVATPRDRTLHALTVDACIGAELAAACPLLKIEEIAEELEGLALLSSLSPGASKVSFQQSRGLLKVRQPPRSIDSVLTRLALEGFHLRQLRRQAPVEVDAPKGRHLVEVCESALNTAHTGQFPCLSLSMLAL